MSTPIDDHDTAQWLTGLLAELLAKYRRYADTWEMEEAIARLEQAHDESKAAVALLAEQIPNEAPYLSSRVL